jgi:diguanylate cyclase (GGDEF)-like protein
MSASDKTSMLDGGLKAGPPRRLSSYRTLWQKLRRIGARETPSLNMVRLITWLAALAAVTTAATVPVSCFLVARARLRGEIEMHALLYAGQVAEEARRNPAFWNALADSAAELDLDNLEIARPPAEIAPDHGVERRRVRSSSGRTLIDAATSRQPAWPLLVARSTVVDGATRLGEVEIQASLRPALVTAAAVACGSSGLSVCFFLLLRILPLRMLNTAIQHASFLSAHDLLTGLPNRRLFQDRLEQALAAAHRDGDRVAVFCLDLDKFKIINDLLGHAAGDATLRTVAARLTACLRASDTLARLGGDEFAVIQPKLRRMEDAATLGRRMLQAIEPLIDLEGQLRQIGLSVGVAVSEIGARDQPEQLMKHADMALYQAKREGRNRVCFFTPAMDQKARSGYDLEAELSRAVAEDRLTLHYQPQVDFATGRVHGAEALLRWNRADHGLVAPDGFIDVAEETGLIVPIGVWVLREACRRAATWPEHISIAVNVSPVQFRNADFAQSVIDAVHDTGLTPSRLELEITEGVLMQNTDQTLATLQRLRELGIRMAMDDFGTGYSSLGYLQKFRFDKIKIDRSFISRLAEDDSAEAIVRAVIGISQSFGVEVNAEGVETKTQADVLRGLGCSEGQGFLYGKPVSGELFDLLVPQGAAKDHHAGVSSTPSAATATDVTKARVGITSAPSDREA